MPVYRLVFRLDFNPVFDIFDYPGKVMRILHEEKFAEGKFLPDLLEDNTKRAITARYKNDAEGIFRILTVEPVSMHGSLESTSGISIERIEGHDVFRKLVKILNKLRHDFNVNDFKRCGLRFTIFDTVGNDDSSSTLKFIKLIDNTITSEVKEHLGEIRDVGVAFSGIGEDKIGYNIKCGPYSKDGQDKYLRELSDKFDETTEHDCIFDIDIFEKDFHLTSSVSFAKWCGPAISRADKTVKSILNKLTKL
jgi:hypothetical protein